MRIDTMNDPIKRSRELAYDAEIQEHGGVETVAKHLCNVACLDDKCLSGREVTIEMLQEVRKEQVNTLMQKSRWLSWVCCTRMAAVTSGCDSMLDSSTAPYVESFGSILKVSSRARANHCITS